MARTINCDFPRCAAVADYMLTVLEAGETRGFCTGHYLASCGAFVLAAGGEELGSEAAAAIAGLAPASPDATIEIPQGELWTCGGCGAEYPSEEMLIEHISAEHPEPTNGDEPEQIVSRETSAVEA